MLTGQSTAGYALVSPRDGWRQSLIFPTVSVLGNGVSLDRRVSSYGLWIELESRRVWGLTLWSSTPFISFRELESIARRLESVHPKELDSTLVSLAKYVGWRRAGCAEASDINLIAEELARAEILATVQSRMSVQFAEENVRRVAAPHAAEFTEGLLKFNDALDPEVRALFGNEPLLSHEAATPYNYLMHPAAKIQCYRRQAMQTFPLLRDHFTRPTTDHRRLRLQQNVDSGNPLLPVLTDYFRCALPVVRCLVGKDSALVGEEWRSQVEPLVDLLGLLKPGYWPVTSEDWRHLYRWLLPVFSALGNFSKREYPEHLGGGLDELAKEGYARISARLERHGITLIDISGIPDFEKALREWSVQVGSTPERSIAALWSYSILKVAVLSHRWHDWLVRRIEDEEVSVEAPETPGLGWPTLTVEPWRNERHAVVALNYPWILQDEGRRMEHCVGTYVSQCRYFGSHIFSLRDPATGRSLSTVELRLEERPGQADEILVEQHRAFENADPAAECKQTLDEFLRHLRATVTIEQCRDIRKELHKRCQESDDYRSIVSNPAWPRRMVAEFRGLLRGYPLLEAVAPRPGGAVNA